MSDGIPVIDIAGLDARLDAIAAEVRAACLDTGFFHLVGHGITEALIEATFDANRRFHARPLDEKLAIELNAWHRGYQPLGGSTLVSSARFAPATEPNRMESFFLRHEVSANAPGYGEGDLKGPNQWPDDAAFRIHIAACDDALRDLGLRLLPVFARAVGEDARFFNRFFDPPSTALRLLHYPPAGAGQGADVYGIPPHTDYGFVTILAQDETGGLAVRRTDGAWIDVPPMPGAFVVNIGDALARWTNDVFNSTPHRVINPSASRSRYSVAMFFDPNIEARVRCLEAFVEGGEAHHPPIRYGDYFAQRLDANYTVRT